MTTTENTTETTTATVTPIDLSKHLTSADLSGLDEVRAVGATGPAAALDADAQRMAAIIQHETAPKARRARKASSTTRAAKAAEKRAEASAQAARTPAAKAAAKAVAPKREMAEDAFGKYIKVQQLQGHTVTVLEVERDLSEGKARFLTALYQVATPKGKVLGQLRFDHGAWFVVGDNDETKVPSISKGIAALAK